MKNSLKISIFAAMIFCSTVAWAQTDDNTSNEVFKKITDALVKGDCDRAQRNYNIWKTLTEQTNSDIEAEIKECYNQTPTPVRMGEEAMYADAFTISQNGKTLSDKQIRTLFANSKAYKLYDSGIRLHNASFNWNIAGGGLIVIGAVFQLARLSDDIGSAKAGFWLAGGGAAMIVVGVSCNLSGKAKISKAVDLYNNGKLYSQTPVILNFGLTQNGIGLAINF
jgi:hypothetical protein